MTMEERNTILEAADILKALGGNNGFTNLKPKLKNILKNYAVDLEKIVRNDIQAEFEATGKAQIAPGVTYTQAHSREDIEMLGMQEES